MHQWLQIFMTAYLPIYASRLSMYKVDRNVQISMYLSSCVSGRTNENGEVDEEAFDYAHFVFMFSTVC